tara:strand:+ start:17 stop:349 length:333 start_codon:yes stop_codon:yes gene_type:complete
MSFGNMDDYSLSDLAGSGAIILASIGGLLTIILSSRCYIKCRLGLTDNCNICMCERKPPPDPVITEDNDKDKDKKDLLNKAKQEKEEKEDKKLSRVESQEPEPEPEILIP